jgi:Predicted membrane protein (DUF2157)
MSSKEIESALSRWTGAGVIDRATAERISAFERERTPEKRLNWPAILAVVFGVVMLGAGVLLFVAAHWDDISPAWRFSLVLSLVAAFHLIGAFVSSRSERMAIAFHALGTAALGAGIFLAGQIFHLDEHWPGGLMLWALGAWIAWFLLRDWVQAGLVAILTPAWLAAEWDVASERYFGERILTEGLLLLAIVYFTAQTKDQTSTLRRLLKWIGGIALLPCAAMVAESSWSYYRKPLPISITIIGWVLAIGLPLALAALLRRREAWMSAVAAVWVVILGTLPRSWGDYSYESLAQFAWRALGPFVWYSLGSIGMIVWGLHEQKKERVNFGIAGFALSVLAFYFSSVMDKLGRSTSLIGLGVLFLLGGWYLEKTRRRLVGRVAGAGP